MCICPCVMPTWSWGESLWVRMKSDWSHVMSMMVQSEPMWACCCKWGTTTLWRITITATVDASTVTALAPHSNTCCRAMLFFYIPNLNTEISYWGLLKYQDQGWQHCRILIEGFGTVHMLISCNWANKSYMMCWFVSLKKTAYALTLEHL